MYATSGEERNVTRFASYTNVQDVVDMVNDWLTKCCYMDCYLPDNKSVARIAAFFALLSDPSRVKLLSALAISPLCVTDLAEFVKMNQTTVSHQLRLLRSLDVVSAERNGKIVKYRLANPKINEILLIGVEYIGF